MQTTEFKQVFPQHDFIYGTEKYFQEIHEEDVTNGATIYDDLATFAAGFAQKYEKKFFNFYISCDAKSRLLTEMYESSPKILAIVFMASISPGKVMIYSNYVAKEEIDMLKVYFRLIGYNDYQIAGEVGAEDLVMDSQK